MAAVAPGDHVGRAGGLHADGEEAQLIRLGHRGCGLPRRGGFARRSSRFEGPAPEGGAWLRSWASCVRGNHGIYKPWRLAVRKRADSRRKWGPICGLRAGFAGDDRCTGHEKAPPRFRAGGARFSERAG